AAIAFNYGRTLCAPDRDDTSALPTHTHAGRSGAAPCITRYHGPPGCPVARFGAADTQRVKVSPGVSRGLRTKRERLLSQSTNQARRGSRKRSDPPLMPPLVPRTAYFSTSTTYRRIVF